jgi:hypothetical protein
MVCVDCCFKLNQSSEFFETSLHAQTILQMAVGTQKGATADNVGVHNIVANIYYNDIHFYTRLQDVNFLSSLSVFTATESARYQSFC